VSEEHGSSGIALFVIDLELTIDIALQGVFSGQ